MPIHGGKVEKHAFICIIYIRNAEHFIGQDKMGVLYHHGQLG